MKTTKCLATLLLSLCVSVTAVHIDLASAQPQGDVINTIRIDSGATAVIEQPSCEAQYSVLMIHGWAGHKDEVGDIYKSLAKRLRSQCIASLRFDVQGESERQKSHFTLTSTFESRVADAQSGLNYLQAHYPDVPVILVGFSLGGATAMELVSRHPTKITGLVLWSSALNPNEVVTNSEYADVIRASLKEGKGVLKTWADITLTQEHVVGMLGFNPIRNLAKFYGHILAIRGLDDHLPAHEAEIFKASNALTEEAYYLGGADHIFHVFDPQKSQKHRVLDLTMQWIENLANELNI